MNQITPRDIEAYKAMRLPMKRSNKATINRELACLKAIMKKAVEWGEIRFNPTITVPVFKEDPVIPEPLTEAQMESFLKACQQSANPDLYPIVVCAVDAGLRRSKLFSLKWENVDLADRWIKIRKTKSNQFQMIPISDLLYATLVKQKAKGSGPYVFMGKKGPYNNINHSLKTAAKLAGVGHVHLHKLRHTFATHLRSRNVELGAIKELLGHKTMAMTERYAKCTPEHLRDAISRLGHAVPKSTDQSQEKAGSPDPGIVRESMIMKWRYG